MRGIVLRLGIKQRKSHRRQQARYQLRGILLGLQISDDDLGRLPHAIERDKAGLPTHSWRFMAVRDYFGGMCDFYGQDARAAYSEPWDGPGNLRYYEGPHSGSTASPSAFIDSTRPGNKTRFVAIVGPGTAFEEGRSVRFADLPPDMILVVEVRNSDQHWMEPGGDLHIDEMPQRIDRESGKGISGQEPEGFLVGFASGEAWMLSNDVPVSLMSRFFTIESARTRSREGQLREYRIL